MNDEYKEIVEWLLDLSSRLQSPGLENAADVIERLCYLLAAEKKVCEASLDRLKQLDDKLAAERGRNAKLAEDNINRSNAIVRLEAELAAERELKDAAVREGISLCGKIRKERDNLSEALVKARSLIQRLISNTPMFFKEEHASAMINTIDSVLEETEDE